MTSFFQIPGGASAPLAPPAGAHGGVGFFKRWVSPMWENVLSANGRGP